MFKNNFTIEKAREMFRSSDCSTYVMARNNPKEYENYKKLNIPKQTELEWKSEMIVEYSEMLQKRSLGEDKWKLIDKMCELVESTKYVKNLELIYKDIKRELLSLGAKERVIISESINGRGYISERSGLIFLSYDIGEIKLAKQFGELSLELLNVSSSDEMLKSRIKNSKKLHDEIMKELFN